MYKRETDPIEEEVTKKETWQRQNFGKDGGSPAEYCKKERPGGLKHM